MIETRGGAAEVGPVSEGEDGVDAVQVEVAVVVIDAIHVRGTEAVEAVEAARGEPNVAVYVQKEELSSCLCCELNNALYFREGRFGRQAHGERQVNARKSSP